MTVVPISKAAPVPQWAIDRARRISALLPALWPDKTAGYIAMQLALAENEGFNRGVHESIAAVQRSFAEKEPK